MEDLTDIHREQTAAYIKGELSGTELTDFETALADDEQLQDEVIFQKKLLSALNLNVVKAAMKQAKTDNLLEDKTQAPKFEIIRNSMQQARVENNKQKRIRRWVMGGLVATFMLFIGMFGLSDFTNNQQYAKIEHEIENWQIDFEIPDSGYEDVSGTGDVEETIKKAKKQYAADKPEQALATLNLIPEEELEDHVLLAKGQINAQLKDYEESSRLLKDATKSDEIIVKDEAHLALGVVYLRMGKKEKAKEQLEQVSNMREEVDRILKMYF